MRRKRESYFEKAGSGGCLPYWVLVEIAAQGTTRRRSSNRPVRGAGEIIIAGILLCLIIYRMI